MCQNLYLKNQQRLFLIKKTSTERSKIDKYRFCSKKVVDGKDMLYEMETLIDGDGRGLGFKHVYPYIEFWPSFFHKGL